jgi:uncharacterized membrane protein YjdF
MHVHVHVCVWVKMAKVRSYRYADVVKARYAMGGCVYVFMVVWVCVYMCICAYTCVGEDGQGAELPLR